jgi:ComF family protein
MPLPGNDKGYPGRYMKDKTPSPARSTSGLVALMSPLVQAALDLVFPPCCAGCGRVDTPWCDTCDLELAQLPLAIHTGTLEGFEGAAATGIHAGRLRDAVHALKYNTPAIADPLGERLTETLKQLPWEIDILVPVPLHASRRAERGYNQSQRLCEVVSAFTGIPCLPDAIERYRDTGHQVGLDKKERQQNVADAFKADFMQVAGKRLLILDDVRTTGATLSACANAARAAGSAALYGLTVTVANG